MVWRGSVHVTMAVLYLEDYIEAIDTLPQDMKSNFSHLRTMELQVQSAPLFALPPPPLCVPWCPPTCEPTSEHGRHHRVLSFVEAFASRDRRSAIADTLDQIKKRKKKLFSSGRVSSSDRELNELMQVRRWSTDAAVMIPLA